MHNKIIYIYLNYSANEITFIKYLAYKEIPHKGMIATQDNCDIWTTNDVGDVT